MRDVQAKEARHILGLGPDMSLDAVSVRAAFRRMLRQVHPDVSSHPDAGVRTARLTEAYEVLTLEVAGAVPPGATTGSTNRPGQTTRPPRSGSSGSAPPPPAGTRPGDRNGGGPERPGPPPIPVRLLSDSSISVAAPAEETFTLLLDTAHDLGEISYLDRFAGIVEVIVEFIEAPTSSLLFSLQGRADGTTEVFCTVEPLSGGDAPPTEAVTRLVLATLRQGQR